MNLKQISILVLLVLVVIFAIVMIATSVSQSKIVKKIGEKSILVVDLRKEYLEIGDISMKFFGLEPKITFPHLLRLINSACDDDKIESMILKGYSTLSLSQAWELEKVVKKFQESGKKVYGYINFATPGNFLLMHCCDSLFCPKLSSFYIPGFSVSMLFIKDSFAKLGIGFDVMHIGKFKGTGEMFSEDSMSAPLKQSLNFLLDDIYDQFTSDLSEGLDWQSEDVIDLIDGAYYDALSIKEDYGLIDSFMYWDQLVEYLVGKDSDRIISLKKYSRKAPKPDYSEDKIALIIAEGSISMSSSVWSSNVITSKKYVKLIRKLAEDDNISAIIMRVNSPGGSALVSDEIYNQLLQASDKKPVIASMSSVAASGGYYISMPANRVFATPYTLTGSIGVVSVRSHWGEMYNKIDAHYQTLKRGRNADIFDPAHPFNEEQLDIIKKNMEIIYNEFVSGAAYSRDTTYEWIDSIGQGRIWSANTAMELGLIDEIGSLLDVIAYTEELIGVPEGKHAKLILLPRPESFWEIYSDLYSSVVRSIIPKTIVNNFADIELIENFSNKPLYYTIFNLQGLN